MMGEERVYGLRSPVDGRGSAARFGGGRRTADRHYLALVAAEARRLGAQLRPTSVKRQPGPNS